MCFLAESTDRSGCQLSDRQLSAVGPSDCRLLVRLLLSMDTVQRMRLSHRCGALERTAGVFPGRRDGVPMKPHLT